MRLLQFPRLTRRQRLLPPAVIFFVVLGYLAWLYSNNFPSLPSFTTTQLNPGRPASSSSPQLNSTRPPPNILLVTALFPLAKSKHSHEEYRDWLVRFVGSVTTDVYFFTTPELEPVVRAARRGIDPPRLTINTSYPSPFSIPPLQHFQTQYTQMHAWDREANRHSPELYAVWNAKPWFLAEGVKNAQHGDGRQYQYAFWTDAGSFRRTHTYKAWPDPVRVEGVWDAAWARAGSGSRNVGGEPVTMKKEDLVFFPISDVPEWSEALSEWTAEGGPVDIDFSEGSFFGSTPETIAWYADIFYAYHDHYISTPPPPAGSGQHPHAKPTLAEGHLAGNTTSGTSEIDPKAPPFHFVGKDQTLINALFLLYPHRFFTVVSPSNVDFLPPAAVAPTPDPHPAARPSVLTRLRISALHLRFKFAQLFWGALRGGGRGVCGDEWFYYQFWLAAGGERRGMRGVWAAAGAGRGRWQDALRWAEGVFRGWGSGVGERWEEEMRVQEGEGEEERCGVVRGVLVREVLKGVLGAAWEAPTRLEGW